MTKPLKWSRFTFVSAMFTDREKSCLRGKLSDIFSDIWIKSPPRQTDNKSQLMQ